MKLESTSPQVEPQIPRWGSNVNDSNNEKASPTDCAAELKWPIGVDRCGGHGCQEMTLECSSKVTYVSRCVSKRLRNVDTCSDHDVIQCTCSLHVS